MSAGALLPYRLRLRSPWRTAHGAARHVEGLLVAREATDGLGWGDACSPPGAPRSHRARLWEQLADSLTKDTPPAAPEARHAWTQARLDLEARRKGRSLAQLLALRLDRPARRWVDVNGVLPRASKDLTIQRARRLVEAGHTTLKLKVEPTPPDVRRVQAVRAAVGAEVRLRLDLNGASATAARKFCRGVEDARPEYVEEPIRSQRPEHWAEFRRRSPVPIAADESAAHLPVAEALIKTRAVDVLVAKPMSLGGIDRCLALAKRARRAGIPLVVTDRLESAVGRLGVLHLAAALGRDAPACGFAGAQHLLHDVAAFPPIVGGRIAVPRTRGLGAFPGGLP